MSMDVVLSVKAAKRKTESSSGLVVCTRVAEKSS